MSFAGRARAAREVSEADDGELRLGRHRLEVVGLGAATGEVGRQVVVGLHEPAEPLRPEVLPGHPQLEGSPSPRALEAVLVEVQRLVSGVVVVGFTAAVVLGRAVERVEQVAPPTDEQGPDVVGLEEPLVGVDGHAVCPFEGRDP